MTYVALVTLRIFLSDLLGRLQLPIVILRASDPPQVTYSLSRPSNPHCQFYRLWHGAVLMESSCAITELPTESFRNLYCLSTDIDIDAVIVTPLRCVLFDGHQVTVLEWGRGSRPSQLLRPLSARARGNTVVDLPAFVNAFCLASMTTY